MVRCLGFALLAVVVPASASGQSAVWRNRATLYGDNTEFFTPYRVGETILGGQFQSFADIEVCQHSTIRAGVFGDVRGGSSEVLDHVKPILSFRHERQTSLGVFGTL